MKVLDVRYGHPLRATLRFHASPPLREGDGIYETRLYLPSI